MTRQHRAPSATNLAALAYAARGWHVLPIEAPRLGDDKTGKRPLTVNGFHDATVDPDVINAWYRQWPDAGVGIATDPSDFVVLDVDTSKGKPGRESLRQLEEECPGLETMTAITGSGGLHAFFRRNKDCPAARRINFRPGLDLIVDGYVVVAPSMHYSGGQYKWSDMRPAALFPAALHTIATARKQPALTVSPSTNAEPIREGGRNDAMFKLGCALYDTGVGEEALKSALHFENQRRFSPPLPDEEVLRVSESVMRRVQPTRDVALGAVVQEIAREAFVTANDDKAVWVRDVALTNPPPTRFYSTGSPQLDKLLGDGVCSSQVCGIIGPPSAGKSAYVNSLCIEVSKQLPMLHVSTELPREELFIRYACNQMNIPWRNGMKGQVPREDMRRAVESVNIKLMGCDDLDLTDPLGHIAREAVKFAKTVGEMPGIAIDYVQLLARTGGDDKKNKVGELTMHIRKMSQALDTPIISVFSTSRDFYGGGKLAEMREADDPTIYLSAAKESGDIEFDCATILFLDVDKLHDGLPKPARVAVARCRFGEIGFAGYRAALDVGRWYPDASAASEMKEDKKQEVRNQDRKTKDQLVVLDFITRMPNRSWREVKLAIHGMSHDRKEAARAGLLETGRIEMVKEKGFDNMARPITRETIKAVVGKLSADS